MRMASSSSFSSASMALGDEKPHVLAVDDSLLDRKLIEKLLTNSSCKVTTAENGQKALELLGLGDGQHTLNSVESPTMKDIPVVIVSSENVPTRIKKCMDEGAEEFMLKPLQKSDVNRLRCQLTKFSNPHKGMLCMGR
ncbi:two-component response regulator ARR17-like isoform X2 [Quercus robur]|uniref:two-component response regulator ARR17-like isoform X2 n=1 Tax=Quercus lobata TaxID=97700 RepID=UPI001243DAA2|nr:two-component response regulator ARR17-like isoform X2 [Quercus lobata]XP_050288385.1 two-component response regulator ARR17-like isoform X2 [Quercus robur]